MYKEKKEAYEWDDELCETITGNVNYAYNFIKENFIKICIGISWKFYCSLVK